MLPGLQAQLDSLVAQTVGESGLGSARRACAHACSSMGERLPSSSARGGLMTWRPKARVRWRGCLASPRRLTPRSGDWPSTGPHLQPPGLLQRRVLPPGATAGQPQRSAFRTRRLLKAQRVLSLTRCAGLGQPGHREPVRGRQVHADVAAAGHQGAAGHTQRGRVSSQERRWASPPPPADALPPTTSPSRWTGSRLTRACGRTCPTSSTRGASGATSGTATRQRPAACGAPTL